MHVNQTLLPLALSLLLHFVSCHRPGQEYTYLSMFSRPQTLDMIDGDNHLGQVYEQLSVHQKNPSRPATVRLLTNSQPPSVTIPRNLEQRDQSTSNEDVSHVGDIFSNDGEDDEEEEEERKEGEEEKQNELLPRESLSDGAKKILVKVEEAEKEDKKSFEEDVYTKMGKNYGEDLDRMQEMLLKIIKQYRIDSLADVPCRAHAHWMPFFLEKLAEKNKNFRYYCVDTRKEVLKSIKETVGGIEKSKFFLRRFWSQGIPKADLVFSWAGLDNMKQENVKKYFTRLSKTKGRHKIIAIGSHVGELQKQGDKDTIARFTAGGKPINVREPPFRLKRPMRIIGKLSTEGNDKQLYLYQPEGMM